MVTRPSARPAAGLFGPLFDRAAVPIASDEAWLRTLLDVEAALARAQAKVGLASAADAEAVDRACQALRPDPAEIGREAVSTGTPVVPLVRALRTTLDAPARDLVHRGATSQDVMDSATMLLARDSLAVVDRELASAGDAAARLAAAHRDTVMASRTLLQHALPTTFGLTCAGWLVGLDEARERLVNVGRRLPAQLGGAAGTQAAFGERGQALAEVFASELGLVAPALPWHTRRTPIAVLAGGLGLVAGAVAKPARDIVLLAQSGVGEVVEAGGGGGSSTLPQKRNPIAAIAALGAGRQAPGLVATLLAQMEQEHERAAGAWHAEWQPLRTLFAVTASAAAWLATSLGTLEVAEDAMAANVRRAGAALVAERIVAGIAPVVGRDEAERLVEDALAADDGLGSALAAEPRLAGIDLDGLLDPRGYLGSAGELVDRALAAHTAARRTTTR